MPADAEQLWTRWRQYLSQAEGIGDVRRRMLLIATELSRQLPRGTVRREQWLELAVEVLSVNMRDSGVGASVDGKRKVLVSRSDHSRRRRFTTAHELGHILLREAGIEQRKLLSVEAEERLCDQFASAALIPLDELRTHLAEGLVLKSPRQFVTLAHHFGVNLRPMAIALGKLWSDERRLLILAHEKGHPRRPDQVDYRVFASVGNPFRRIPLDVRLSSIGLGDLVTQVRRADDPELAGVTDLLDIRFWRPSGEPRSGRILGRGRWEAYVLHSGIICMLDISASTVEWAAGTRTRAPNGG